MTASHPGYDSYIQQKNVTETTNAFIVFVAIRPKFATSLPLTPILDITEFSLVSLDQITFSWIYCYKLCIFYPQTEL